MARITLGNLSTTQNLGKERSSTPMEIFSLDSGLMRQSQAKENTCSLKVDKTLKAFQNILSKAETIVVDFLLVPLMVMASSTFTIQMMTGNILRDNMKAVTEKLGLIN